MCREHGRTSRPGRRFLLLAAALATGTVQALPADHSQPIHIRADSVVVRQQQHVSIYQGHVRITQGTMVLTGDKVTVHHGMDGKPLTAVVVGTPATYSQQRTGTQPPVHARAQRIDYAADRGLLHLIGSARVQQGPDVVSGADIRYDIRTRRIEARGGAHGPVHITIHPQPAHGKGSTTPQAQSPGSGTR